MATLINVNVDAQIKDGIPFEIVNPKPSKQLLEALREVEEIKKNPDKYPSYDNREDLKKALLSDN